MGAVAGLIGPRAEGSVTLHPSSSSLLWRVQRIDVGVFVLFSEAIGDEAGDLHACCFHSLDVVRSSLLPVDKSDTINIVWYADLHAD